MALKWARYATKRRKIVSIIKGYHGHSGLSVATGDERFSKIFLSDRPDEFFQVPFNDLAAMEAALKGRDVAAVIMETIPATYGFPMPAARLSAGRQGALREVRRRSTSPTRCRPASCAAARCGAGRRSACSPTSSSPAKGLSGGLYPIARLHAGRARRRLAERGRRRAHIDHRRRRGRMLRRRQGARDRCSGRRPAANVRAVSEFFAEGVRRADAPPPDVIVGVRQMGTVIGVEFDHPEGAVAASRGALRERGLGDLLLARQAGAAVQARRADVAADLRGGARPLRRGDPAHPRRCSAGSSGEMNAARASASRTTAPELMLERARWAAAGLAEARPRGEPAHRPGGRRGGLRHGAALCRMGGARDRLRASSSTSG